MRGLGRYFARAVVRRVVYVIVAIVFAWFGLGGKASAQTYDYTQCFSGRSPSSYEMCGNQGEAAAALSSVAQYGLDKCKQDRNNNGKCALGSLDGPTCIAGQTTCFITQLIMDGSPREIYGRSFPAGKTCAERNANKLADAALNYTEPPSCIAGCQVQGTPFSQAMGSVKVYGMKDRTYNGAMCTPSKPTNDINQATEETADATKPKQPECTALGSGQTGCVKPDGDYCATSSTGKTFCWKPAETGKKTDASDGQVKSPKGDPVTPPDVNIPDKDWQRTEGHQQTACVNDKCTTYNVTNYTSVPSGTAKNSTGDNSGDGTGNTSGNGKPGAGTSDDGKEGDKDSASESGNCTVAPICVGDTLKCLHLKFTWKTQCNTERGEVEGGKTCADGDVPVCAGKSCKAAEYTQVLQSWRTRCGLEKDRDAAKSDADRGAADAAGDDEKGEVAKLWASDGKPGPQLDQNRLSIGGGDLLGGNIDIMGTPFTLNAQFYDALAIIKKIIIASAMVAALVILWRS